MSEMDAKNIALLIDADNVNPSGINAVLTVLAELGQVNIRRAYGNWAKDALKKWGDITNRFGIQPHQQFDLTRGKNATDMAMTIDAVDLLYQGKVDGFGIMSSDSDFTPLVTRLRQDGLPVYCFGDKKTPEALQSACTRFIDIDKLMKGEQRNGGGSAPSDEGERVDEDVITLLGDAWKASSRDEDGFARLQEVGQIAGNRSSFDVRNFGFKRLSELVRSLDRFELRRGEDNQLYVKRLR
ncbi:NYN domain-containing protein [Erythrobacter sp. LQ02-29]|uniref:NYN domain-containing protein n=1 Tax=unclassified Erythrobacter TaxID=2633097 RepID=UPI001BFC739F|nr:MULTISPECIES: NYN domain-containing protein [unclassified Erythrobacter]MCP9223269.1 NYN domain-containing protein [Erythrobacter sp. LQ02-29]QWC58125.1 NYN domain-containing protein [Erythrobacter sp. 3-20A1M]